MLRKILGILSVLVLMTMVVACDNKAAVRPILIQGAEDKEVDTMIAMLEGKKQVGHGKYAFYEGKIEGYPFVISKTNVGIANAAAATTLGIEAYNPAIIINQGTAGGHDPALRSLDVVLGENVVNMGAFKTDVQAAGEGVDPNAFELTPLEVMQEGNGKDTHHYNFPSDPELMALAESVKDQYTEGKVVRGTIGSADQWNNQIDRIAILHQKLGTTVEEMETASVGQVAMNYKIPYISIRVLSNTAIYQEDFNPDSAIKLQDYVMAVAKAYIAKHKK